MRLARTVGPAVLAVWMVATAHAQPTAPKQPAPPPQATSPASAPDAAAIETARRHFQQGIALYNDGNYSAALAEFQAVYQTKPTPGVLYNIGLTYKNLFQYNEAIRTLEQYEKDEPNLAPERRAEVEQILGEMRALLAPVTLSIEPEGAEVKIDGRVIGHAPIGQYLLATGRHVLDVSRDGYVSKTRELMITAGVPVSVQIALPIIPKSGRVRIAVSPPTAIARIDGQVVTPPLDVELPLGGHTLEVAQKGYQIHREELLVAPGQTREVFVKLARPPIYKRAALWVPVGVGVVVAAGLGFGLGFGLNQNHPIVGTLNPGSAQVGR